MFNFNRVMTHAWDRLPKGVQDTLDSYAESLSVFSQARDPSVLRSLGPSAVRGLLFKRAKQGGPTVIVPRGDVWIDWECRADQPEMADLYQRAKDGQWVSEDLPWRIDVDLEDPERAIFPANALDWEMAAQMGLRLDPVEQRRLTTDLGVWTLSQFLHGEQGALMAAAQVTAAVQHHDGKLYGATQVMDEARHVEVFSRYLKDKAGKTYQINDNLFTIIDALVSDNRWDIKFLGMQIMVEGLALGAFGTMYRTSGEPLLRELLKQVILDEARHVHYGVVALRDHYRLALSERERHEREDWAFEVSMLMRNRFFAYEVYDEWAAHRMKRSDWRKLVYASPVMRQFRQVMFSRLIPNLREIGLLTERIRPHYAEAGLTQYFQGAAADTVETGQLFGDPGAGSLEAGKVA